MLGRPQGRDARDAEGFGLLPPEGGEVLEWGEGTPPVRFFGEQGWEGGAGREERSTPERGSAAARHHHHHLPRARPSSPGRALGGARGRSSAPPNPLPAEPEPSLRAARADRAWGRCAPDPGRLARGPGARALRVGGDERRGTPAPGCPPRAPRPPAGECAPRLPCARSPLLPSPPPRPFLPRAPFSGRSSPLRLLPCAPLSPGAPSSSGASVPPASPSPSPWPVTLRPPHPSTPDGNSWGLPAPELRAGRRGDSAPAKQVFRDWGLWVRPPCSCERLLGLGAQGRGDEPLNPGGGRLPEPSSVSGGQCPVLPPPRPGAPLLWGQPSPGCWIRDTGSGCVCA